MQDLFIKWFMAVNAWLLRVSHGRIGSHLGKQTVLLLHTTGRNSGADRALPIAYFTHGPDYLIVASNWGKDQHANWYLNLKKDPHARLEIGGRTLAVQAREATGSEYDNLWQFVTQRHPPYLEYQTMTPRHIPIMIFEPASETAVASSN